MNDFLSVENLMMFFFIVALVISIWKIYVFLPTKPLEDDDTTKEATDELINLLHVSIKYLCSKNKALNSEAIFTTMINQPLFDSTKFWRFNQNRLNQLIQKELLLQKKVDISELCK